MERLQAWCCKEMGEVVAAHSAREAREVLMRSDIHGLGPGDYAGHEKDLADACWSVLSDEKPILEEDGGTHQTVGEAVAELGKPGPLWSFEV
jgi:hypothetical protein